MRDAARQPLARPGGPDILGYRLGRWGLLGQGAHAGTHEPKANINQPQALRILHPALSDPILRGGGFLLFSCVASFSTGL